MKRLIVLLMSAALALAACATPATPAATTSPAPASDIATPDPALPTSDATLIIPTPQEAGLAATLVLGDPVTLIAPGSVTLPEATEPVDPNQPPPRFQTLTFTMASGVDGDLLMIELNIDGSLSRNGVVSALPASEVEAVHAAMSTLRLYDAVTSFTGPARTGDANNYGLTLMINNGSERFIPAMEAYTPPQYLRFFNALAQLGLQPFPVF